jgi:hypothetical protein
MPSNSTFLEVKNAFQAIAGLESLTSADEFFLQSSTNRAVTRAYDESDATTLPSSVSQLILIDKQGKIKLCQNHEIML